MDPATGLIVAGVAEVFKFLIMARNSAVKVGMTPEQFEALAKTINEEFEKRDSATLPDRG